MGKGISEMIAVEPRESEGIEPFERDNRLQLLEEVEMSLADLADAQAKLEVGRLQTSIALHSGMDRDWMGAYAEDGVSSHRRGLEALIEVGFRA